MQAEFPGVSGFSASNLWRMRQFYQTYKNSEKLAPMVREIGWSHNVVIFEQCKTVVEYALRESAKPIGVATYRIVSALPEDLRAQLPSPEQIAKLLPEIDQ